MSADLDRYINGENLGAKSRLEAYGYVVMPGAKFKELEAEIERLREIEAMYLGLCK